MSSIAIPVIAGLATGIAFVIVFALLFSIASPILHRSFNIVLALEGLKDRYSVGEQIDFNIRATGYGTHCGYPIAQIMNIDKNEIVRTIDNGIDVNCDPEPVDFDKSWTLQDLGVTDPIMLDKVGHYKIIINFGRTAEQYFIVDDIMRRAIDNTRNLDEVKAFLNHYPTANATVYFITTCADESCETLIRVPKTVEYWLKDEAVSKMALLRISIDEREGGKPPSFFQVSCQLLGTEVADEIHGSSLSEEDITGFLQNHDRCP